MKSIEVMHWLRSEIALLVDGKLEEIDIHEPFSSYGLDSSKTMLLSGELAAALNMPVSPTVFWDYPSLYELSHYLGGGAEAQKLNQEPAASREMSDRRDLIAIVGIGCRFPNVSGSREFWGLLLQGGDAVRQYPVHREQLGELKAERLGGYLDQIDGFDYPFFNVSYREAIRMDPQQRLLLEVAWDALMDAGISPDSWANTKSGVFIGISNSDYGRRELESSDDLHIHSVVGGALCIAANRLSYFLGLQGPSMAIDTACSSSLVAVHQACSSIWSGESEQAIAGGVNVILSSAITSSLSKAGMLAADDRCKTFDARADGYVRGEGCGIVVLKPLSKALGDGDEVYAVIPGSAVNQDGRSNGITAPNQSSQEKLLESAYEKAGIQSHQIGYIEAHGTGTYLGDPIEVKALGRVLSQDNVAAETVYLGSVKSNIGHLESAAGIAGLIKSALIMKHGVIPPSLHFQNWNPEIPHESFPFVVPTESVKLRSGNEVYAGVSSFGFGGTNAHIVLGRPIHQLPPQSDSSPFLFMLSAARKDGLALLAQKYVDWLKITNEPDLMAICSTLLRGRKHHEHRLAIAATSKDTLLEALQECVSAFNSNLLCKSYGHVLPSPPGIVYYFPEHDTRSDDEMKEMLTCDAIFQQSFFVVSQLYRHLAAESLQDHGEWRTFAKQFAHAEMLRSWGLRPISCLGEGIGGLTAMVVEGQLSLPIAIERLVRGDYNSSVKAETEVARGDVVVCLSSAPVCLLRKDESMIICNGSDELGKLQLQSQLFIKGLFVPECSVHKKRSHMLPGYPWNHHSCWKPLGKNEAESNGMTCFC
jgi:acyl transferase domain-containing protein